MREILFRAKTKDGGEWIYGDLIHYKNGDAAIFEEKLSAYGCEATEICKRTLVDSETICQYTGIDDKNGTKIFTNDICRYENAEDGYGIGKIEDDYISWHSGKIREKNIMTPLFYLHCSEEWEVIGNDIDNPDGLSMDYMQMRNM